MSKKKKIKRITNDMIKKYSELLHWLIYYHSSCELAFEEIIMSYFFPNYENLDGKLTKSEKEKIKHFRNIISDMHFSKKFDIFKKIVKNNQELKDAISELNKNRISMAHWNFFPPSSRFEMGISGIPVGVTLNLNNKEISLVVVDRGYKTRISKMISAFRKKYDKLLRDISEIYFSM